MNGLKTEGKDDKSKIEFSSLAKTFLPSEISDFTFTLKSRLPQEAPL